MSCPFYRGPRKEAAGAHEDQEAAARRIAVVSKHLSETAQEFPAPLALNPTSMDSISFMQQELRAAKKEVWDLLEDINCNPILIRAAWHDSGTFDKSIPSWPACGGANGSIRFEPELKHDANAGIVKAMTVYLKPIKARHPAVSWADLLQLGAATAIEHAKGPKIDMLYGRVDIASEADCPPEGRLPDAAPPFGDSAPDAASHLRNVFYRMGFNDQEIVALSGAHTLGRAFKERSGTVLYGYGAANGTAYTNGSTPARPDGKPLVGMAGGQSWTKNWLTFDNSYFAARPTTDAALLRLPTDAALYEDPGFRPHYLRYAADQGTFFREYAAAHKKLSELGSAFFPAGGIRV